MISGSKEKLQQAVEYTLLKPDFEERYAIELCFKLEKNATETYGMLQTAFGAS